MSFKFTFREITPEDTEILRILKLRNAKPEEHICCEILRGDGITMKTWYSKADVALWGEDYIKANSKMKYIDGDWTVSLDVEPWKRTHGVSSKKVTSPSSPRYPTWLTGHVKEWAEKRLPKGGFSCLYQSIDWTQLKPLDGRSCKSMIPFCWTGLPRQSPLKLS